MKDKTLEAGRLRDETQHSGEGRTLGLHQGKMLRGNVSSAGPNSNSGVGRRPIGGLRWARTEDDSLGTSASHNFPPSPSLDTKNHLRIGGYVYIYMCILECVSTTY